MRLFQGPGHTVNVIRLKQIKDNGVSPVRVKMSAVKKRPMIFFKWIYIHVNKLTFNIYKLATRLDGYLASRLKTEMAFGLHGCDCSA